MFDAVKNTFNILLNTPLVEPTVQKTFQLRDMSVHQNHSAVPDHYIRSSFDSTATRSTTTQDHDSSSRPSMTSS